MIKPTISLQELQAKIGARAKSAPTHRFWGLYVHIKKFEVIEAAYLNAKKNNGAPGVDGVTFEQIEDEGRDEFLRGIVMILEQESYSPQPYRRRDIPKENGKFRTISIPTIRDRVVQGAVKLIMEPIFEADFSDSSFGGRPGRSAHDAIECVRKALVGRKHRVLDLDLSAFFDNITHRVMLERIAKRVSDATVLALLKKFLKGAGKQGLPQGSPLSPLIANLALTDLDIAMDRGKEYIAYVRYLDDIVVLCYDSPKGRLWVDRALARISVEAAAIGVEINTEKTRMVTMTDPGVSFDFLGFETRWTRNFKTGRWFPFSQPRKKKTVEIQNKVRDLLASHRHLSVEDMVSGLNPILRGWVNFFRFGHSSRVFSKLKCYVEFKIRRFAAKQRKRQGFGWKRWSKEVVYGQWNLFGDYRVQIYGRMKGLPTSIGTITPTR